MDLINTTKSLDSDSPSPPAQLKASTFTNGVLKKHYTAPIYRECLRNHAASMGGHALDGCGEFMPSPSAIASDPTSLKCAACGCHRNFHRRDSDEEPIHLLPPPPLQPPLRHHSNSPPSPTPPPISTSYFPSSAPQMLLALSSGGSASRKRFRTKFTQEQKDKMLGFAEKVGWKMQKRDEDSVEEFCREIGVSKGVLKVWMHNNKHILVKRGVNGHVPGNGNPTTTAANVNENGDHNIVSSNDHGINGTCSSS